MTDHTDSATEAWHDHWKKQDAWTAAEFAMLCCGWNPSGLRQHSDQDRYSNAPEMISRAVRVEWCVDYALPYFLLSASTAALAMLSDALWISR